MAWAAVQDATRRLPRARKALVVGLSGGVVRSTRRVLPVLPSVGFSGPPSEPVPFTAHRSLQKSRRGKEVPSCGGGPRVGNRCAPTSEARDAHPAGVEQLPGRGGWPPSAIAVASAEFLRGHSAMPVTVT